MTIADNMMRTARVKEGIVQRHHRDQQGTLEVDRGKGQREVKLKGTGNIKVITNIIINGGGGYTKIRDRRYHGLVIEDRR
jgi:hypothetical protein